MCGIVGVVSSGKPVPTQLVEKMRDSFSYRGPDDCGLWSNFNQSVVLGHRRLSIIDRSHHGHQPMVDEGSQCIIVFNGEVFNYLEIKLELKALGHQFCTGSDTEVILKSYLEYGNNCVHKFNGMFAIAIWDPRINKLFMLRDRLGIKPLYYFQHDEQFIFASECKAIDIALPNKTGINVELIDQYMSFGYVPGENTLQHGIKKLLPGYQAIYDIATKTLTVEQYWDVPFDALEDKGFEYYLNEGKALLNSAIDLRLRSDVPLGIFLSGGIDSSAVVGLLAERTQEPLQTYSVAYDFGKDFNETYYARMISEKFNTNHHELFLKPETFREFIPEYIRLMDEPVTESAAIALYFLSKMTTEDVTVVLSGEGSDEIFGGYDLYRYMSVIEKYRGVVGARGANMFAGLSKLPGLNTSKLGKYLQMAAMPLHVRYKGISTYDARIKSSLYRPEFKSQLLAGEQTKEVTRFLSGLFSNKEADVLSQMLYFDTKTWLVDDLLIKADRMSMASSLELRVPFLDYRLVEFAAKMPSKYKINNGQGKYILKKMMEGLLPDEIIYRKKMGFPTPLKMMFQGALKDYSSDLLLASKSKITQYFERNVVAQLLSEHQSGKFDHHRLLWQLVVLEEWLLQHG